jgi:hypothetical protein
VWCYAIGVVAVKLVVACADSVVHLPLLPGSCFSCCEPVGRRELKDQSAMKMTLNQLLVEMDGFDQNNGVIVIAATNFPDSLDKALIRPGRFDKHVDVPMPDIAGRKAILELYGKKVSICCAWLVWRCRDVHVFHEGTTIAAGSGHSMTRFRGCCISLVLFRFANPASH